MAVSEKRVTRPLRNVSAMNNFNAIIGTYALDGREDSRTRSRSRSKRRVIGFWVVTALFCLQIGFTAYAQLRLPEVAEAFTHLGFPAYFRVELSWAKLLGIVVLLAPVPARLKEWAYAGFAITLASALVAHFAVGDGPQAWSWAAATFVLWGLSYFFWRRIGDDMNRSE